MVKLLSTIVIFVALVGCSSTPMEQVTLKDGGQQSIGNGLYLKRIDLSTGDRVYLLVNEKGQLASASVSTSITVRKGNSSIIESNSVLVR